MRGISLQCHQIWLGNPQTQWRFIDGKVSEVNVGFPSKPWSWLPEGNYYHPINMTLPWVQGWKIKCFLQKVLKIPKMKSTSCVFRFFLMEIDDFFFLSCKLYSFPTFLSRGSPFFLVPMAPGAEGVLEDQRVPRQNRTAVGSRISWASP
jgi:hypothetical protein